MADDEYGLQGLADLPLLEQVHRLFNAIQQRYPYKETEAWKTLPADQKRKMLDYIRRKRQEQTVTHIAPSTQSANEQDQDNIAKPETNVQKADPYLDMLRRRKEQMKSSDTDRSTADRWKMVDEEFSSVLCTCGKKHATWMQQPVPKGSGKSKATVLRIIGYMMTTFGDAKRPCKDAVQKVYALVGDKIRQTLAPCLEDDAPSPSLRELVDIFQEEAAYYGRWREFRSETKQNEEEENEEDVEEEQLAEELDLFAVAEEEAVFNATFFERIRFADQRTAQMDWSLYDDFAKGRKHNFLGGKGEVLKEWIGLPPLSKASLEFINFVAYHNIGCLVEAAIKHKCNGELQALTSPLLVADIEAISDTIMEKSEESQQVEETNSQPKRAREESSETVNEAEDKAETGKKQPRLMRLKRLR